MYVSEFPSLLDPCFEWPCPRCLPHSSPPFPWTLPSLSKRLCIICPFFLLALLRIFLEISSPLFVTAMQEEHSPTCPLVWGFPHSLFPRIFPLGFFLFPLLLPLHINFVPLFQFLFIRALPVDFFLKCSSKISFLSLRPVARRKFFLVFDPTSAPVFCLSLSHGRSIISFS